MELDIFNQQAAIFEPIRIIRRAPRLLSLDETSAMLSQRYGGQLLIGIKPAIRFFQNLPVTYH